MDITVFFSWQSDTPSEKGRTLIERALRSALADVALDAQLDLRPDLDQDTQRVPGSPPMVAAILEKVERCSVFVADVTLSHGSIINADKRAPNSNVVFELGYAMRRLTHSRVLLVLNLAYGGPEQLPFDLRGHRAVTFRPPPIDSEEGGMVAKLAEEFAVQLRLILKDVGPPADIRPPLKLRLGYRKLRIESDRHDYRLFAILKNAGDTMVRDWSIEVQLPRALFDSNQALPEVPERSTPQRVVMRLTQLQHSGPIFPGDDKEVFGIDYHMDHSLYALRGRLFPEKFEASFFVADQRVALASESVKDMQNS